MTSQPTCYALVEVPGDMEIFKVTIETIGQAFGEKIIAVIESFITLLSCYVLNFVLCSEPCTLQIRGGDRVQLY